MSTNSQATLATAEAETSPRPSPLDAAWGDADNLAESLHQLAIASNAIGDLQQAGIDRFRLLRIEVANRTFAMQDSLTPAVNEELTATAHDIGTLRYSVCGVSGMNAHFAVLNLADKTMEELAGAMSFERMLESNEREPMNDYLRPLSETNRIRAKTSLRKLLDDGLGDLRTALRSESTMTRRRLDEAGDPRGITVIVDVPVAGTDPPNDGTLPWQRFMSERQWKRDHPEYNPRDDMVDMIAAYKAQYPDDKQVKVKQFQDARGKYRDYC